MHDLLHHPLHHLLRKVIVYIFGVTNIDYRLSFGTRKLEALFLNCKIEMFIYLHICGEGVGLWGSGVGATGCLCQDQGL